MSHPFESQDWDPITALQNLEFDRAMNASETPMQRAKRLFEENLPVSIMAICHMATYSQNETIRLNASKYVVDRSMGSADKMVTPDGKHAWEDIYEKVLSEAEGYLARPAE